MAKGILRSRREREALGAIHDPPARYKPIAGNVDFDDARQESRERFKKRHGRGRTVVVMPGLPWKRG